MSTLRSDIVTRARDYLNEAVADIYSDVQLRRYMTEEILSLPSKDIFLEQLWQTTLVSTTDYSTGISLPTGTFKLEELKQTSDTSITVNTVWEDLRGYDFYANALFLNFTPSDITLRGKISKSFTPPTDDVTAMDVPDEKCEIVVWGVVIRAYRQLIGYLTRSKNWDAISKPDGININSVRGWLQDARQDYKELVQVYATSTRPRDIDLVS